MSDKRSKDSMPKSRSLSSWALALLLCGGVAAGAGEGGRRAGPDLQAARPCSSGSRPTTSSRPMASTIPRSRASPATSRCRRRAASRAGSGVAEEVSDISLACRQIGPIRFKKKFAQGEDVFRAPPLAVLQEDADRARLRRQAQRAGLHGLFRQADRRLAEELDVIGARSCPGAQAMPDREVRATSSK